MGKGTVLVVDDEQGIVDVVVWVLEDAGYRVVSASDGREALQATHEHHPDLVLMDIMMPEMDGIEASYALRGDPATHDIPIVLMSARHRLHTTGTLMPVDARLAKPFDVAELVQVVERCIQKDE